MAKTFVQGYTITSLSRGQRNTKAGPQTGLYLKGVTDRGENRDYFWSDQYNAPHIAVAEQVGVGGSVSITLSQGNNSHFWDVVSVVPAQAPTTQQQQQQQYGPPAGSPPAPSWAPYQPLPSPATVPQQQNARAGNGSSPRSSEELVRTSALDKGVQFIVGMASSGMIPKSKITSELLVEKILAAADVFAQFIKGQLTSKVTSSPKDVQQNGPEMEPPGLPPLPPDAGDDIPF